MKKHLFLLAFLILLQSVLCTPVTLAAPPPVINYQGRLLDGTNLVNGLLPVVLRVYDSAVSAVILFEDSNNVSIVDGLYSTPLGAHPVSGTLTGALDAAEAWLEIEVNGVILSPRERIVSVAYALDSGKLEGFDSSFFAKAEALADEQIARTAADTNLSNAVSAVSENLAMETADRIGADASLSNQVTALNGQLGAKLDSNTWASADSNTNYVRRTGDTMTGALTLDAPGHDLVIDSPGNDILIGNSANGHSSGVAVGGAANAYDYGAAVGLGANASSRGAAIGRSANGANYGAAAGWSANGYDHGAAVGYEAAASNYGSVVGYQANGVFAGSVVGAQANAWYGGAALGGVSDGSGLGVAAGYAANGRGSNVAIGAYAHAAGGFMRAAIGFGVTNQVNNSAAFRGDLYLDGGAGVFYRPTFGTGGWTNLLSGTLSSDTNYVKKTGDTMTGALNIGAGVQSDLILGSPGSNVMVGRSANGYYAGAALGSEANGSWYGAALGLQAKGGVSGVGVGAIANGQDFGTAVGNSAKGNQSGAALGVFANGANYGVAVGRSANSYGTNVAIGIQANAAGGQDRIAIGHDVTNDINETARIRGTLYLDGATGVYVRSVFGDGSWSSLLADYADTGFVASAYVNKSGDTMSGALNINAGADSTLRVGSAGTNIAIGAVAIGSLNGVAEGRGANGSADGVAVGAAANGTVFSVAVGPEAKAFSHAAAVGSRANAWDEGTAIGSFANGYNLAAAAGANANAANAGASFGYNSLANLQGTALGYRSTGDTYGVAVGGWAVGRNRGVAVGYSCEALDYGTAVGYWANGINGGIAIGHMANAVGSNRTAIGWATVNTNNNSVVLRGNLYLDGGDANIRYRTAFGGTNAWSVKSFVIDHPLDPENKVLRHYCVEGPEVWNVYAGTAALDPSGEAVVQLPAYFEKLNTAPQYLLTAVGTSMPNLFVKAKVRNNRFVIGGGTPGGEVCWEVKARRNDPACIEDLRSRPVEQLRTEVSGLQIRKENAGVNTGIVR